jgi:hypothetical protein
MALAMLVGLLFATAILFASPTNAAPSCEDDPAFVYKKGRPPKDGTVRNCYWIKNLKSDDRKEKICNSKDGRKGKRKKSKNIFPLDDPFF